MKRFVIALAALGIAACTQAAYKDGSYTGVGKGKEGDITVQVDVAGGKITAVKVVKHTDTPVLLQAAEKRIAKRVVKNQSVEGVKGVSGATLSSNGILEAVKKALAKAK